MRDGYKKKGVWYLMIDGTIVTRLFQATRNQSVTLRDFAVPDMTGRWHLQHLHTDFPLFWCWILRLCGKKVSTKYTFWHTCYMVKYNWSEKIRPVDVKDVSSFGSDKRCQKLSLDVPSEIRTQYSDVL